MRRDKNIILNDRLMPDVIAAPQNDVVADFDFVLDDVVFENKTVFAISALCQTKARLLI